MKKLRHILSFVLALSMVFCMMPSVFAGGIRVESERGIPVTQEGGDGIAVKSESSSVKEWINEKFSDIKDFFAGNNAETLEGDTKVAESSSNEMLILHLDCGRKYFSVESINKIIYNAAVAGFNYVQLAVGNDGLRFLLNDMSITVNGTTYSSEDVTNAIKTGNDAYDTRMSYTPGDTEELTEAEMNKIIAYANACGMQVIPLINTPGHMDAILSAINTLTGTKYNYDVGSDSRISGRTYSNTTIDITKNIAVDFTKAILQKYITYFASKGCEYFNMGADEYANDVLYGEGTPGTYDNMGFGHLYNNGNFGKFVTYVNDVSTMIKNASMKPMAFNDSFYMYEQAGKSDETKVSFDTDIAILYWSAGWGAYHTKSASYLSGKEFSLINTHESYYWVLGKSNYQPTSDNTKKFIKTAFNGSTISNPLGSTFCIWCDYPGAGDENYVVTNTASAIEGFGEAVGRLNTMSADDIKEYVPAASEPDSTPDATPDNGGEPYDVVLDVGGKKTFDKVDGGVTATIENSDIVSASYEHDKTEATTELNEVSVNKIVSGKQYYIGYNKSHYLKASYSNGKYSVTDSTTADCLWTFTGDATNGYTISTTVNGQTKYLWYSGNNSYSLNLNGSSSSKWKLKDGMLYCTTSNNWWTTYYYLGYSSGWKIASSGVDMMLYEPKDIPGEITSTTVTITGAAPGDTTVTIGETKYNVHVNNVVKTINATLTLNQEYTMAESSFGGTVSYEVTAGADKITVNGDKVKANAEGEATVVATVKKNGKEIAKYTYNFTITKEDLSRVSDLEIEYWITNIWVYSDSAKTKHTVTITANDAYGENGIEVSSKVPQTGVNANDSNVVYWKTTRLTSDNIQKKTDDGGTNQTTKGNDFKYIRYYGGKWSFSDDRKTWTDIDSTDQIVAYYLQTTKVTDEVTTNVVDWGNTDNVWDYYKERFVVLDFSVMFESGERTPKDFPVSEKTQWLHCDSRDTNIVKWSSANNSYYRVIDNIYAINNEIYEVYMITVTPTKSSVNATSYTYTYDYTQEKVYWVDSEANLGDFKGEDKQYKSVSGNYKYHTGGEAVLDGIEILNKQGMLITYYIHAKETESSLTVNYVDNSNPTTPFYSYNISVYESQEKPYFDEKISLPETTIGGYTSLTNGAVVNSTGKTQYVSSDLSTMPSISASYRYCKYECKRVERSADGKTVTLYYDFENSHSFVADFGQPIEFTLENLGVSDNRYTSVDFPNESKLKYGTIKHGGIGDGMTYTPNKIMTGVETINVTFSDSTGSITHFIHIYPATNVLYEETVATLPTGSDWTVVETDYDDDEEWTSETAQDTEKLGSETLHGYDNIYSENTGFSAGQAYVATLEAKNVQTSTNNAVTFTFTGTGFDLISACGPDTGMLLVNLYKGTGDNKVLKRIIVADTYFTGDETYIKYADTDDNGVLDYQVPVLRKLNLDYDTYTVEVYGYMVARANVATASYSMDSYDFTESIIANVVDELGFDDDPSLYEFVFMDENSILNGGTGESPFDDYSVSVASNDDIAVYADTSTTKYGYVYIDGIRVYETMENVEYTESEKNTSYYSIVEEAKEGTTTFNEGSLVYVEGAGSQATLKDYQKIGPQNEIYLISGATLAFELNGYVATQTNKDSIQIAARAVTGSPIMNDNVIIDGNEPIELTTGTEMYYKVNVHESNGKSYLMITCNSSDGENAILSISGIKLPYGVTINTSPSKEVQTAVYARACAIGSEVFVPSVFTVNVNSSVKAGKSIMITAQTSTDVDKLIVEYQGESYELAPNNKTMVEREMSSVYTYSKSFKTAKSAEKGDVELTFVACSADDNSVMSEPITKTVTIK